MEQTLTRVGGETEEKWEAMRGRNALGSKAQLERHLSLRCSQKEECQCQKHQTPVL